MLFSKFFPVVLGFFLIAQTLCFGASSPPEEKPNLRSCFCQSLLGALCNDPFRFGKHAPSDTIGKQELVSMARDASVRRILVRGLIRDIAIESDELVEKLRKAKNENRFDPEAQSYDIIVFGAGIHDGILNNIFRANPGLKVLTIEKSDRIANTFIKGGHLFKVGSPSEKSEFSIHEGNVDSLTENELHDALIQIREVDPSHFPTPITLAQVAAMNRAIAPGKVLFKHAATSATPHPTLKNKNGTPWNLIQVRSTKTGETFTLQSKVVIGATGLGSAKFPNVKNLQEIRNAQEATRETKAPRVMHYVEMLDWIGSLSNPYAPFIGKRVALIGKSEAAMSAIGFFLRLSNPEAYGSFPLSTGSVKELIWLGQDSPSWMEFVKGNPLRYAEIALGFSNQGIRPIEGRLTEMAETTDESFKLKYTRADGTAETDEADIVIFATGYENNVHTLFQDAIGQPSSDFRQFLNTSTKPVLAADGEEILARQVVGNAGPSGSAQPFNMFIAGPAAGNLVSEKELQSKGGTVSAFNISMMGPKTKKFAKLLMEQLETSEPQDKVQPLPIEPATHSGFELPKGKLTLKTLDEMDLIYEKARLLSALEAIGFSIDSTVKIRFTRISSSDLEMSWENGGEKKNLLVSALKKDPRFVEILFWLIGFNSKYKTVQFEVVKNGNSLFDSLIDVRFLSERVDVSQ